MKHLNSCLKYNLKIEVSESCEATEIQAKLW